MRPGSVEKSCNLPPVGTILSTYKKDRDVPVDHRSLEDESRWNTYAFYDTESDEWVLDWRPAGGLLVFFEKRDFTDLRSYPWCEKVKVTKHLKKAILVSLY